MAISRRGRGHEPPRRARPAAADPTRGRAHSRRRPRAADGRPDEAVGARVCGHRSRSARGRPTQSSSLSRLPGAAPAGRDRDTAPPARRRSPRRRLQRARRPVSHTAGGVSEQQPPAGGRPPRGTPARAAATATMYHWSPAARGSRRRPRPPSTFRLTGRDRAPGTACSPNCGAGSCACGDEDGAPRRRYDERPAERPCAEQTPRLAAGRQGSVGISPRRIGRERRLDQISPRVLNARSTATNGASSSTVG